MTGVWMDAGDGWKLGKPRAFDDEATLQHLIKEYPQLLPLAGSPRLLVLGSEVRLGRGYTDVLAVEASGRPTIIEVKLASNPEARRAIVAQVTFGSASWPRSRVRSHGMWDDEWDTDTRLLADIAG